MIDYPFYIIVSDWMNLLFLHSFLIPLLAVIYLVWNRLYFKYVKSNKLYNSWEIFLQEHNKREDTWTMLFYIFWYLFLTISLFLCVAFFTIKGNSIYSFILGNEVTFFWNLSVLNNLAKLYMSFIGLPLYNMLILFPLGFWGIAIYVIFAQIILKKMNK